MTDEELARIEAGTEDPRGDILALFAELRRLRKLAESATANERARCDAWVQHARGCGETDMRQVSIWIDCDDWPPAEPY
jgi:hypothetical protein